jgi:hypothetical protein
MVRLGVRRTGLPVHHWEAGSREWGCMAACWLPVAAAACCFRALQHARAAARAGPCARSPGLPLRAPLAFSSSAICVAAGRVQMQGMREAREGAPGKFQIRSIPLCLFYVF